MNLGTIVTPNSKGQVVIPYMIRKSLGIDVDTPLQLIQAGQGIMIYPVVDVVRKGDFTIEAILKVLDETRGSWGPATKEDKMKEVKRRRIELAASRKRRKTW